MTVSTVSNDYCLGNSSRIKYETIRNQTKRKQLLGKTQIRRRENTLGKKTNKKQIRQRENILGKRTGKDVYIYITAIYKCKM